MNSAQCSFNPRNTFSYKIKYYYYSFTKYPRMFYELIDGFIQQGYSLLTLNSESVLDSIDIRNKVLKRILHPTQLLFLVFLLATFLTINNNFNKESSDTSSDSNDANSNIDYKNDTLKFFLLRSFLFSTFPLIILILSLFKSNPGIIVKDKEIESYISKKTAQLEKCKPCNTLRVLRSNHCVICNHCIAKFELHSMWLCKDIGAGNAFIYALFLVNLNLYLLIAQVICFFATFVFQEFNGKEFLSLFWFIALCYINNKNVRFCSKFLKGINTNITFYEDSNYFRFPYLWEHFNRRFFNPFDKGSLIANWKDVYASYSSSVNSKVKLHINNTRNSENQRKNDNINNNIEEDNYNKDEDLLMETENEINENRDKSTVKSKCTDNTNDNSNDDDFDIEISEVNENKDPNCSDNKSLKETNPLRTETDNINSENNFFKNSFYNNKIKNNTNSTNKSNSPKVQISNNFDNKNTNNNNMNNNSNHRNHSHETIYEKVIFSNNHPISFIVSDETISDVLITSSEGNYYQPYKQYNPLTSEPINWVKLRLYSIMDIINSPMRQSLIMNITQMQNMQNMQNIQRNVGNNNNNNNNINNNNSDDNTNTNFINEDKSMINVANDTKDENNLMINTPRDINSNNIISNSNNTSTNYNNSCFNENIKDQFIPINNNKETEDTYEARDEDNTLFDDLNNEI